MSLGYTPAVEVTGANAALINSRLIDWEYVDAAGIRSDTLKLTVNIEGLDGLPSVDDKIGLRRGYKESGLVDAGMFVITRVTPQLFPAQLVITATAAPFKVADETDFKARKSASFGPTTLGAIFRELTARHGFSPRIAADLDAIQIDHLDQSNETDMGFLTRIAKIHDAVTKPVNELYVMARAGQLKSLSGKTLPVMTISVTNDNRPGDSAFVNASLDEDSRVKFKGCKTTWWDGASGKECVVETGEKPFKKVTQRYQNEAEAKAAGEGMARKIKRGASKIRIECPGNPGYGAEGLVVLDGSWPSYLQGQWSIDKVTESGSRQQSYRTAIEASVPLE